MLYAVLLPSLPCLSKTLKRIRLNLLYRQYRTNSMTPPTIVDRVKSAGRPTLRVYTMDELLKMVYPDETRKYRQIRNVKEKEQVIHALADKNALLIAKHTADVIAWENAHPQLAAEYEAYFLRQTSSVLNKT